MRSASSVRVLFVALHGDCLGPGCAGLFRNAAMCGVARSSCLFVRSSRTRQVGLDEVERIVIAGAARPAREARSLVAPPRVLSRSAPIDRPRRARPAWRSSEHDGPHRRTHHALWNHDLPCAMDEIERAVPSHPFALGALNPNTSRLKRSGSVRNNARRLRGVRRLPAIAAAAPGNVAVLGVARAMDDQRRHGEGAHVGAEVGLAEGPRGI